MSAAWADALLRSSVQGGAAGLLVWAILKAFPRIPAAVQDWLWRIVAIKFLLGVALPVTIWRQETSFWVAGEVGQLPNLILVLSIAGILITLISTLGDAIAAARLTKGAADIMPVEAISIARDLGLRRMPRIMVKPGLARPLLAGVLRPTIMIPEGVGGAELRMVLAHEMAHVRRKDLAYGWLAVGLEAIFFFHPVVWILRREMKMGQEIACDALAMRASHSSLGAYGQMLLSMTISASRRELALTAQMAGTYAALKERIVRLQRNERRLRLPTAVLLGILAVAVLPTWRAQAMAPKTDLQAPRVRMAGPVGRAAINPGSPAMSAAASFTEATPK